MTIYKPKPGEKKLEKKKDVSHSAVRIPEDVVWRRICVTAFVEKPHLKWLPLLLSGFACANNLRHLADMWMTCEIIHSPFSIIVPF